MTSNDLTPSVTIPPPHNTHFHHREASNIHKILTHLFGVKNQTFEMGVNGKGLHNPRRIEFACECVWVSGTLRALIKVERRH